MATLPVEAICSLGKLEILDSGAPGAACGWMLGRSGAAPAPAFQRSHLSMWGIQLLPGFAAGKQHCGLCCWDFLSVRAKFSLDEPLIWCFKRTWRFAAPLVLLFQRQKGKLITNAREEGVLQRGKAPNVALSGAK